MSRTGRTVTMQRTITVECVITWSQVVAHIVRAGWVATREQDGETRWVAPSSAGISIWTGYERGNGGEYESAIVTIAHVERRHPADVLADIAAETVPE